MAHSLGFDDMEAGKAGIIATELGGNLIKHAGGGELILRPLKQGAAHGMEVLSLDKGPGMASVGRCMEDGYSTAGSPGTGLGAVARLSHTCEVFSETEKGTVILSQLWGEGAAPYITEGAICLPVATETLCGDGWAMRDHADGTLILMCDGLGHGPVAAQAAEAAIDHFQRSSQSSPAELIRSLHLAMRATRGAAVAVILLEHGKRSLRFAGVGNISGMLTGDGRERGLLSHNGIVGHQIHKVQELTYPWSPNASLTLFSDGLQSRWKMQDYPGLAQSHPSLIASVLYRDFQRGRDDVTVMVLKGAQNA